MSGALSAPDCSQLTTSHMIPPASTVLRSVAIAPEGLGLKGIMRADRNTTSASALRLDDLAAGTVVENRELMDITAPGAPSKRHIALWRCLRA